MFCTNCGAEVQGGQVYCPTCGKQVTMAKAKSQVSSQSSYNYQSTYSSQNPYNSQRSNMTPYYTKKKSNMGAALVVTFLVVAVLGVVVYGTVSIMGALHEVSVAKNSQSTIGYSADVDTYTDPVIPDEPAAENTVKVGNEDDPFAGYENLNFTEYTFAKYANDGEADYVVPIGTVNANTVIYKGITAGEYADFVDGWVLEKGRTLNRQLYYDLLSIYLLDPSLYKDDQSFATSMIYASTVSNQFHDMAVELKAVRIPNDNRNLYAYKISAYGNDDVWVSDAANKKFYFNNGKTEYNSTMYDEATFGLWYMAVKEYFGITVD